MYLKSHKILNAIEFPGDCVSLCFGRPGGSWFYKVFSTRYNAVRKMYHFVKFMFHLFLFNYKVVICHVKNSPVINLILIMFLTANYHISVHWFPLPQNILMRMHLPRCVCFTNQIFTWIMWPEYQTVFIVTYGWYFFVQGIFGLIKV